MSRGEEVSIKQENGGDDKDLAMDDLEDAEEDLDFEDDGHNCSICLQELVDRTVIPTCSHEFCFECLLIWTGASLLNCHVVYLTVSPSLQSNPASVPSAIRTRGIISSTTFAPTTTTKDTTSTLCVRPPSQLWQFDRLLPRPSDADAWSANGVEEPLGRKSRIDWTSLYESGGGSTRMDYTRKYVWASTYPRKADSTE